MKVGFSPKLIARTKTYFKDKYGLLLSDEETSDYLNSLSELYLAFLPTEPPPPLERGGGSEGGV